MRHRLISAAAACALAGVATIASAQDDKGKGEGDRPVPGAAQKAPDAGQKAPDAGKAPRQETREAPKAAQPQGSTQPKAAQQPPAPEKQKSAQPQPDAAKEPKAAQQPGPNQRQSTEQKREPGKEQPKAAQQPAPDKQKSAEPKQQSGKEQPQPGSKAAEQPQSGSKAAEQGTDKAGARTQVSQEQRTNIRERLVKETRVEKARINVTVNVGRSIPRSVRLHALPVSIVAIAPAYRGYQYVLLEDETIVIVDPRTYVVIDTISAGGPGHATLALSAADQRFLLTALPKDRRADVRVRLALGAEVPRSVELLPFPSVAVERVPSVQRYRYIVSGDDIVIVDPADYSVVMVVSD